jgi:hypothetical protein
MVQPDHNNKHCCNFFSFFDSLLKNQCENNDNLHSVQKAVAGLREQFQDFRVQYEEDNAETNRQLQDLKKRLWLLKESVA